MKGNASLMKRVFLVLTVCVLLVVTSCGSKETGQMTVARGNNGGNANHARLWLRYFCDKQIDGKTLTSIKLSNFHTAVSGFNSDRNTALIKVWKRQKALAISRICGWNRRIVLML